MNCCSGTNRFFSFFAKSYARRLENKGFENSQKHLFSGLESVGFDNQSVLEIGCGTGFFHHKMIQSGASNATGIDISEKMIDFAQSLASNKGLEQKTAYLVGDFVETCDQFGEHDVLVLDKVICCYPDSGTLIRLSTGKCRISYALSYPRDSWIPRVAFSVIRFFLALARSGFKPKVYPVSWVREQIEQAGFRRKSSWNDYFWISEVYQRESWSKPA